MSKFVVVRGDGSDISAAASEAGGSAGAGIAPLNTLGPDDVEIVEFSNEEDAHPFSIHRPDWFGTVFSTLEDAERNAVVRAEGQ